MQLFDIEEASKHWNQLSSRYSHKSHKSFSAWEILSYYLRHNYSRQYDGGLLRVIAFFGESFPDYISDNEVIFQAGPMTASISSSYDSSDWREQYLLLNMAKCFSESEHLNRYIKEYTNAYHEAPQPLDNKTMYDVLHNMLAKELEYANHHGDSNALCKLNQLIAMIHCISIAKF